MPNSHADATTLICSSCQQDYTAEIWLIVDTGERPDLVERIREGSLHSLCCPQCGEEMHLDGRCYCSTRKKSHTWCIYRRRLRPRNRIVTSLAGC